MKLRFIGCAVFRHEVEALLPDIENEIVCEWLPQGLHAAPETLRRDLQDAIDRIDAAEGVQAVLLGYGLCGRGVEGLRPRHAPLVLPRTHDCIGVFLGGHERYLDEFRRRPGTYWFSRGFIEHGGQPGVKGKHRGVFARYEELYETYRDRYGEELARYLVEEWDQRWMRNFTRAAWVAWDYPGADRDREHTRACAANLGWTFEEIPADFGLLRRMLTGAWRPDEFLVVLPGTEVVATQDGRVLDAMSPAEAALAGTGAVREETTHLLVGDDGDVLAEPEDEGQSGFLDDAGPREGLGLGFDAGGTYTDAALYDFAARRVLADGKGLTTPHDPALGVAEALRSLPAGRFAQVRLVSLATTFATNAIVEGKGCRVGLLLAGYDDWSVARIPHRPARTVPGAFGADGLEREPLDEDAARAALRDLARSEEVGALAVVGSFACRNPAHEVRLRALAEEETDLPLVCGHELSNDLGAIERAVTAALNARISPVVVELVRSVEAVLADAGVRAPLVIVRADGSLVRAGEACRRPVEMILSGPAASLAGAHALTGREDAVVVDMGGTTSDVALLRGGRPVAGDRGAVVGDHRTVVRAPAIRTSGLGGDSRIRVERNGGVEVGPRRVLPVSRLAIDHPHAPALLEALAAADLAELRLLQPCELFVRVRESPEALHGLNDLERGVLRVLREGPATVTMLGEALDYPYLTCLPVARLEDRGLVLRAGLTPTDLLVAEGALDRWDADAARLALRLAADRAGCAPDELADRVRAVIRERLVRALAGAAMGLDGRLAGERDGDALERLVMSAAHDRPDGALRAKLALDVPVIGIGAPAGALAPDAARALGAEAIVPDRAGVAGAVGAITGSVVQRVRVLIRPDAAGGGFVVHAPDEARRFARLEPARAFARDRAADLVRRQALAAGAGRFHIRVHMEDRQGASREGGFVYIETRVSAEAAGAPRVGSAAPQGGEPPRRAGNHPC